VLISGKWYAEFKVDVGPVMVGICPICLILKEQHKAFHTGRIWLLIAGLVIMVLTESGVDNTEAAYGATFGYKRYY
jgi:hypothetical protein